MKISFTDDKPKYIQLFEHIAYLINNAIIKPGTKLPSKRNLSIDLNVSINTILNAYNLLLDEGYIYSLEKKGYYVSNQIVVINKPAPIIMKKTKNVNYEYDFTTQNVEAFPDTAWKKIIKNNLEYHDYLNKTEIFGSELLRQEIANHLLTNRGIDISYNQILIGSGMEMLEGIIKCTNIDNITLENPGYHKLKEIAKNLKIKENYIDLDSQGCKVPDYKTILYTTPFNQFPTGIKMSISRKKELIYFAEKTNSYIIEDDFDAEFRINSNPTTALKSLSTERVIFFSTFSTTIYPGLRIAYAVLPQKIIDSYYLCYKNYTCPVPTLLQLSLKEFMESGMYASHINRRKKVYLKKRELCYKILKENGISCDEKRNYTSLLIKINKDINKVITKCKEDGIFIQSLSSFDIYKEKSNYLILGYTAIPYEKINKGLNKLINIIKEID